MVATRKSLPSASDDLSNLTEKQKAALKELQIDANDAILNGQRESDGREKKVYHWRGAVYEYQGNEPPEWLKDEKRHSPPGKRKRESDGSAVLPVKKQRSSLPSSNVTPKPRTSSVGTTIKSPTSSTKSRKPSTSYDNRAYDFTRYGQEEPQSCIEAAREAAQKKGYQVSPLPEEDLVNARGKWLASKVCEMAKLNRKAQKLAESYNGIRRWIWEREEETEDREPSPSEQLREIPESPEPMRQQRRETTTTSTTRTIVRTTTTTTSHHLPNPPPPSARQKAAFTTKAKGGQTVRWSVDPHHYSTSSQDDGGIRAEEAIFHGRLDGESKQARRRRVRREMAMLEGWERVE